MQDLNWNVSDLFLVVGVISLVLSLIVFYFGWNGGKSLDNIDNISHKFEGIHHNGPFEKSFDKILPKDYNKLTSKNEWYLFNLQSIYFKLVANNNENEGYDIFSILESIAIAWNKKPEDIFTDYTIIANHYKENRKG